MKTPDQQVIYVLDESTARGLRDIAFHLWKAIDILLAERKQLISSDSPDANPLHAFGFWEQYHNLIDEAKIF